ncbi:hypothetical protein AK88_01322 [Plasmodium fragile]|uniref:Uncharacterized protein n=1 Tax=Plasmodium fragile TaxID=5857 RepID=A0A0D9QPJ5_PLAFR|nr:uncharacterized protein AK88_01322 [Plasmodium fragile]KJP89030.1 hypothetical protein AK88_01322 [Plasmodium fragile]
MFKKYILVISANLLLKIAFNSSPFGVHCLGTLIDPEASTVREGNISVNYQPTEHNPSEAYDYVILQEHNDGLNVANEKHENEKDVELQCLDESIKSDEGEKPVEEKEDDDESNKDEKKEADGGEHEGDCEVAGEHVPQELNENGIDANENTNTSDEYNDILDGYKTIYFILFTEFETTETYLEKIMNCTTDEEKNELLDDHIGILKEMYENSKKNGNFILPFELRDSMALRISDRLRDFCFSPYLTDSGMATLKCLFSIEQEVFKGLFYYVKHKNTYSEKKEVINDLELIRYYHDELVTEYGLYLTEEQLDNAAMRVSNFVHDVYFLCASNY